MADSGKKLIQSIQRGFDILALFVDEKNSLGLSEIAKRLGLPKTTAQGIVQTLLANSYLEQDAIQRYRLGPMLFQLGMKYATNMDLINIARVWMERLCRQFDQPVNVGMLVNDKVIVVMRVEPENRFMVFPQAGSVIPTHSSSIGKILAAFIDEERRRELIAAADFEGLTVNTIRSRKKFITELSLVRDEGVAFDNQENLIGLSGVAGPIFSRTGEVIAGFAVTGDSEKINQQRAEIISAVKYTSEVISSQLGYQAGALKPKISKNRTASSGSGK
jgi:DNA-binding IclR family transcriptional regulator